MTTDFKRGDNFIADISVTPPPGGFSGWTLQAQMRVWRVNTPAEIIADLAAVWIDEEAGTIRVSNPNTAAWPVGPAVFDVLMTSPVGVKTTTPYQRLNIIIPATQVTETGTVGS